MIPHSRPTLGPRETRAAARVLASGHLAMGPEVQGFEREAARRLGRQFGVATASGTAALQMSLQALGAGPGREVVCPSYVCSAILNAVHASGAAPIVADVDRTTHHLTAALVKAALTRRTAAVVVPHLFGRPAPVRDIARLGIPVVEDCAMTLGPAGVGRMGTLTVLSFYATKLLTSGGQGGMVLSDARGPAEAVRDRLLHDNRTTWKPRFNLQMTDLAAAVGRVQLARLDAFLEARRRLAARYTRALTGIPGIALPLDAADPGRAWFRYAVEVADARRTARALARAGVEAKPPVFRPLHRYLGLDPRKFPAAEALDRRVLSLPIYPSLSLRDQDRIVRALVASVRSSRG